MLAVVVSEADEASVHIGEQLLAAADWRAETDDDRPPAAGGGTFYRRPGLELRTFEELHIDMADPAPAFGADGEAPDLLAFVSRHSGETGPLLTAHFTGNFGPADYGGEPGAFARAAPNVQKRLVEAFDRHAPEGYEVGIEGTHHGPTAPTVPSLFVELGSGEAQWDDPDGARAVARAVLALADGDTGGTVAPDRVGDDGRPRHLVGFGGGHYAPRATRIVRDTAWAVGHVGSDWQLEAMGSPEANRDVLDRAFAASRADLAVVEGTRPDLAATLEDLGYRVVSETWVGAVGDRPLPLVETLEAEVAPVDDGLRFGDVVPEPPADAESWAAVAGGGDAGADAPAAAEAIAVRPLPNDLLAGAQGVDPEATRAAVERHAVAFDTEQAGTRAAGEAAFADAGDRDADAALDALVDALADVLRGKFDAVERETGAVVAREEGFDPALAADHGVPEGPKFGRLAGGEAVEVDGETVRPADVRRTKTERFALPARDGATGGR